MGAFYILMTSLCCHLNIKRTFKAQILHLSTLQQQRNISKTFLEQKIPSLSKIISKSLNLLRIFQLRKKRGKFKLLYLDLSLFMQHNKYGNKIELKKIGEVRQSLNNVILCRLKNERHKLTEWCRGN